MKTLEKSAKEIQKHIVLNTLSFKDFNKMEAKIGCCSVEHSPGFSWQYMSGFADSKQVKLAFTEHPCKPA